MKSGRGGYGRHQSDDADQVENEDSEEGQHSRSCFGRRHVSDRLSEKLTRPLTAKDLRKQSHEKIR